MPDRNEEYPELKEILDKPSALDPLRITDRWKILSPKENGDLGAALIFILLVALLLAAAAKFFHFLSH